jgi:hypothetical protein
MIGLAECGGFEPTVLGKWQNLIGVESFESWGDSKKSIRKIKEKIRV